jgi:Histidine kinase-, DNA gyrase B-, and HSP90-like ATPase
MTVPVLERRTFSVSRAADFLEARALVSQTGQPEDRFGNVVIKELLDNALDACETAAAPPEITVTIEVDGDARRVTVADNGNGIPPEVVARILDYSTLTSDKALYRSPCRGAQGNALKTIVGIRNALGIAEAVVIEARGIRHLIMVGLDAAGNADVVHVTEDSPRIEGTLVSVPLPADMELDAARWVRGYALVNPHASFTVTEHAHGDDGDDPEIYKATVGGGWRKPVPSDPTSAWWYDDAAFAKLAASLAAIGDDRPVGAFVAEFKGLSATGKRKQITAAVPGVKRISDLARDPGAASALLREMKAASTEPKVSILGQVPEAHYVGLLDELYGVERHWYQHGGLVHDGIAWHIEVIVAETAAPGDTFYACNYAVSFGDPLADATLRTAEVYTYGAGSFLSRCDAIPESANDYLRAAIVHVTCAAPVFTDKGKVKLVVPAEVADVFARVLWQAGKDLHREDRAADRAARVRLRAAEQARKAAARPRMTMKEAVFDVIPEAVRQQRGGTDLPFSAHSLFYKIRPLFLQLLPGETLTASYCEQTLIPEYEREHGQIEGMYREPRGEMHHPHDPAGERTVPLGTREVRAYVPPEWTFDKILVIEKAGLWPVLEAARLADRYDMAVITSEGFAAEACRTLLADLGGRDVTVFVLHDADHPGYNIARTIGAATARMPGHHVDVVDLGLTVDDAVVMGMESETYYRKNALPARLEPLLSEAALDWFTGTVCDRDGYGKPVRWKCRRVELNAFTSPGLIAYIEDGLRANGADGKVIPPPGVLAAEARRRHDAAIADEALRIIAELVDADAIAELIAMETAERLDFTIDPAEIAAQLERDRTQPWGTAVAAEMASRRRSLDIRQRVTELLAERGIGGTA